jgi:15-cis-phytoene synthase
LTPASPEGERTLQRGLAHALDRWRSIPHFPELPLSGRLLRPRVAWLALQVRPGAPSPSPEFWDGALAIQLIHEASLLHDDVLDQGELRRGAPSFQALAGPMAALVRGDHLLTAGFRVASGTGSVLFLQRLAQAVERTVAGEQIQGRTRGRWVGEPEYREIVSWKTGELFGSALALPAALLGDAAAVRQAFERGVQLGVLYQMLDDFLDLCAATDLGKPPLQDLQQQKWTWPLSETGLMGFGEVPAGEDPVDFLRGVLFRPNGAGGTPMDRALSRLRAEGDRWLEEWAGDFPSDAGFPALVSEWMARAESALHQERGSGTAPESPRSPPAPTHLQGGSLRLEEVRAEARALGGEADWQGYFAHHARSFRFAARLFPETEGTLVAGVYAFCRFTDLVDRAPDPRRELLEQRLDAWMELTRRAYRGEDTGVPFLTFVLGESVRKGVPLSYAEELIRGVAMDLDPPRYEEWRDLRRYSYRVASVVGLWLTELFGTHTAWVLRRAEAMGHAMQLTNILRDVGEDLRGGRLYLPRALLDRHGVTEAALQASLEGGALPRGWVPLMEELLALADAEYEAAIPAIPALPLFFQRPVAVAGRVYQGIHREIRKNGYDSLNRRAHTSFPRKIGLAGAALWELRKARRRLSALESGAIERFLPTLPNP